MFVYSQTTHRYQDVAARPPFKPFHISSLIHGFSMSRSLQHRAKLWSTSHLSPCCHLPTSKSSFFQHNQLFPSNKSSFFQTYLALSSSRLSSLQALPKLDSHYTRIVFPRSIRITPECLPKHLYRSDMTHLCASLASTFHTPTTCTDLYMLAWQRECVVLCYVCVEKKLKWRW